MKNKLILSLALVCVMPLMGQLRYENALDFRMINKGWKETSAPFQRVPLYLKDSCRKQQWIEYTCSAGLAIRFATNSSTVAARYHLRYNRSMNHFAWTGIKGSDLYRLDESAMTWRYVNTARPLTDSIQAKTYLTNTDTRMHEYMLYLPLYDGVEWLEIGVDSSAVLTSPKIDNPRSDKRIVIYGSSIQQGGCVSRTAMAPSNIIQREMNMEVVNLATSGEGKLDHYVARLMAGMTNVDCFVLDPLYNNSPERTDSLALEFIRIVRRQHPTTPIVMIEANISPYLDFEPSQYAPMQRKNEIWRAVYDTLHPADPNLYYMSAKNIYGLGKEGLVDGLHMTDYGARSYADSLKKVLTRVLNEPTCPATPDGLLTGRYSFDQLQHSIVEPEQWVPYPAYSDRAGWDSLMGPNKERVIAAGERRLTYRWQHIPASAYLEFERSGDRGVMERIDDENNNALTQVVLAELAEGKGRFINQIVDGLFYLCERSSWDASAHLSLQPDPVTGLPTSRSLPNGTTQLIDLYAGDIASMVAWTYYFFHDELDKVNPSINRYIRQEMEKRVFKPYFNHDHWWMCLHGEHANNWTVWCNFNCAQCFLLMDTDPQRRSQAIWRSMCYVDKYLNTTKPDGASEEGPSYWQHAAGKLINYLTLMKAATNGLIDLSSVPQITNMGEYIVYSQIGGDHWVVNFADATAQYKNNVTDLVYTFGQYVHSPLLLSYAQGLKQEYPHPLLGGRDISRILTALSVYPDIEAHSFTPNTITKWYPQTEFIYLRRGDWFFAAKSGYNAESHNHNDVGSFILFRNNVPMMVDAGTGTYCRQTFSDERYTLWMMQSGYHNLPVINGSDQCFGEQYKGKVLTADTKRGIFTVDISNAYPAQAQVKQWQRQYKLTDKGLTVTDCFQLNSASQPNELHFLLWKKEDVAHIHFDHRVFDLVIEDIPQPDPRLNNIWGMHLYRVRLIAKYTGLKGKYSVTID